MLYDSILAKSFSKHEQKKMGYGALVGCLLIAFCFCIMLKPHFGGPLLILNLRTLPRGLGIKMLMMNDEISTQQLHEVADIIINKPKPICTFMERSDFCDIDMNVRIHGESSSVFFTSSDKEQISEKPNTTTWKIKPYPRKDDQAAMKKTREWSVKKNPQILPQCSLNHTVPAIIFSNGGYAGNHFHDFSDLLIPLFITARKFNGEVKFLITDAKPWWVLKYGAILSKLSNYDIISIDNDTKVHCFPQAIIGLKRDKIELGINPLNHSYTMIDFKEFLRSVFKLKRNKANETRGRTQKNNKKPQLLIVARRKTRSFTNPEEIRRMGKELGFKVVVAEPDGNLKKVAEMVNSCDVMMGVHGAGLTNSVFLPENAILVQIVPFGKGDWISREFFGEPSKEMDLRYLEYKMELGESSLIDLYPKEDGVLRDPQSIEKLGWSAFKSIYFDKQNVKLDVDRFRPTLLKALELLKQ